MEKIGNFKLSLLNVNKDGINKDWLYHLFGPISQGKASLLCVKGSHQSFPSQGFTLVFRETAGNLLGESASTAWEYTISRLEYTRLRWEYIIFN